ncbi:MAG: hypothetical protein GF344_01930 [Chitinivibrionales bacterium]|nr:hypothetical protein [Chitinivibrionales bacterium]MBD3355854.1 hypothetical protein [Chitinivibrionales bacterium]
MTEFFIDLSRFAFLRHALAAGLLSSIACGIIGSYVTVRRTVSIAGAIAHCTLGGMGVALYLNRQHGWTALTPLYGAVAAALIAALAIGTLTLYGRQREDTVLNAVWALGMAVGLLFISRTSGVRIVGIVMVIALLALPAATAAHAVRRLPHMMAFSIGLSMIYTTAGLGASYSADFPAGPTIILFAGAVYLVMLFAVFVRGKLLVRKKIPLKKSNQYAASAPSVETNQRYAPLNSKDG